MMMELYARNMKRGVESCSWVLLLFILSFLLFFLIPLRCNDFFSVEFFFLICCKHTVDDHHAARLFGDYHAITSAYVNPDRVLSAVVADLMDHEDRNGAEHCHRLLA
jgi:hypothetical protein